MVVNTSMSYVQYNSKGQLHGTCQFKAWTALYDNGEPISATLNDGTVIKIDKNTEITNEYIVFMNDAGQIHREDGPAAIDADGYKAWYINDMHYGDTEEPPEEYLQALVDQGAITYVDAFVRGSDGPW